MIVYKDTLVQMENLDYKVLMGLIDEVRDPSDWFEEFLMLGGAGKDVRFDEEEIKEFKTGVSIYMKTKIRKEHS